VAKQEDAHLKVGATKPGSQLGRPFLFALFKSGKEILEEKIHSKFVPGLQDIVLGTLSIKPPD
jgi:hypothetical protein